MKNHEPKASEIAMDIDETLPLYDGQLAAKSEIAFPDSTATPEEVRQFLSHILQQRSIALRDAERIAAKWTVGTGKELRDYTIPLYCSIFKDDEIVWALYTEIRTRLREKTEVAKWTPDEYKLGIVVLSGSTTLAGFLWSMIYISWHRWWTPLLIVLAFLPSVMLILVLILVVEGPKQPGVGRDLETSIAEVTKQLQKHFEVKGSGES